METPISMQLASTKAHLLSARLLRPVVWFCRVWHIDANWITGASLFVAAVASYFLAVGWWWLAMISISINGIMDAIDGEVARSIPDRQEYLKKIGAFLDPAVDRIADSALVVGMVLYAVRHYSYWPWVAGVVAGAGLAHLGSSWIRAKIESMHLSLSGFRPLTRLTFQVQILLLCLGAWYAPHFFLWAVLWICGVTITIFIFRFIRALILLYQSKSEKSSHP